MTRSRSIGFRRAPGIIATLAAAGLVISGAGCGSSPKATHALAIEASADPAATTSTTTGTATAAVSAPTVSIVAQAAGPNVKVYDAPDAATPARTLTNPDSSGAALVFLVQRQQGPWLNVLLPVRPNGSTGWINAAGVHLSQHDFRIVVELAAHRITIYQGATVVDTEPIGVGTQDTPTPGGLYYTKELLRPPDPSGPYGPYAYGLSGFSDAVPDYAGGEGVIGIHGTNDPTSLGRDASHGCIRMSNAGITKLAGILPLGVPVSIQA